MNVNRFDTDPLKKTKSRRRGDHGRTPTVREGAGKAKGGADDRERATQRQAGSPSAVASDGG
jgi:hypothetical protein